MSLTKLFNKNYFVQNILKSKAIMAIVIGIIPILNAIFLMAISSNSNTVVVGDLTTVSILNIIGMYVLPIVLSLCLFGYVFKKKSVDFINSMPLTRKTIYVTNSIGGILLIIAMMLINAILLCIESLIFTNLIIPFSMILDYFIIWTISYIFVFTAANIATSISGNHITMLVVTAIILFLIPFMHNYITGFSGTLFGEPYYIVESAITDDIKETEEIYYNKAHVEKLGDEIDYTLPYNYISGIFRGEIKTYSLEAIIKMAILSIIYFIIGMYLFEKRKMEVNETSFKSDNAHMILKSLTLLPIGVFAMILINETSSATINLFILGLIIAYCFIYDLITTKTIRNIKLGVTYFIITALINIGLYHGVNYINTKVISQESFNVEDITSVACYIDEVDYSEKYTLSKMSSVFSDNEELLKIVKENMSKVQEYEECSMYMNVKLANGEIYRVDLYLELEEYNKIVDIMLQDEKYMSEYKNIDYSKVQALTIRDTVFTGDELKEALKKLENVINNVDLKDAYKLPETYTQVYLELYKNHENVIYDIPLNISEDLLKGYIDYSNSKVYQFMKDGYNIYNIYSVRMLNMRETVADNYEEMYGLKIEEYINTYIKNNLDENIDVTKPMLRIRAEIKIDGNYENVEYYTNSVVEYIEFVNNIASARGDLDE